MSRQFANDGIVLAGAILMSLSALFTYHYGPMGGPLVPSHVLRGINYSWEGVASILTFSGVFLGIVIAIFTSMWLAFASIRFLHLRYISVLLVVFSLALGTIVVIVHYFDGGVTLWSAMSLIRYAVFVCVLAVVALSRWSLMAKIAVVQIVGTLMVFSAAFPIGSFKSVLSELTSYGIGFGMLFAGNLIVLVASVRTLMSLRLLSLVVVPPEKLLRGTSNSPDEGPADRGNQ